MQQSQLDSMLQALRNQLKEQSVQVAIGLDFAAQESNWGLCVLVITEGLTVGELCLLLPQPRVTAKGKKSKTLLCRPSQQAFVEILGIVREANCVASVAVDVPFGWPTNQAEFLQNWSAESCVEEMTAIPDGKRFAFRFCDRQLCERFESIQPLAVGADRIALAARSWAETRLGLKSIPHSIDFGLELCKDRLALFECYPGAFVKRVAAKLGNYKKIPAIRRQLLEELLGKYQIPLREEQQEWLEWAIEQKGSPDAFDAFLCALSAWDHLKYRRNPDDVCLTTPRFMLDRDLREEEIDQVRREGWILVRAE
ncbi:DUF429 domain-containing protein [Blastopirellula sp. JC732]|uniref:DUF429 domain-containing protein n=1 Tax=Blastopirellula sediminis TaxID=2894196 RepID=A0A9X1MID2_9BACT|nr:DUF429 domain-containing protein [Blastopirellula sediminis]MCC9608086.1 DUF429 domain-containing protein [Blastopirellula sediminis]MCC9627121.1 DUF429 domain-containing protein [Blastopirellula sediminis]